MSGRKVILVTIFLLLSLLTLTNCQNYVYDGMGLNEIPSDLSPDALTLSFQTNNISSVPSEIFRDFHALTALSLRDNVIHTFPNLTHVADTLVDLRLGQNLIGAIPAGAFDAFKVLKILKLNRNLLTELPDMSALGGTIEDLSITFNSLCFFQDMQFQNPSANLVIRLKGNPIDICDCANRWLLDLRNAGHFIFVDDKRDNCSGSIPEGTLYTAHASQSSCPSTCPALSTFPSPSAIACFSACRTLTPSSPALCRYLSYSTPSATCVVRDTSGVAVRPDAAQYDTQQWRHYVVT